MRRKAISRGRRGRIAEGQRVSFAVMQSERGPRAIDIEWSGGDVSRGSTARLSIGLT
jgi:hypothetical protein